MINLLPPEIKEQIRYGRRNVSLRSYVVLTLIIALALSLSLYGADWYGQRELARLDSELAETDERLGPVKALTGEGQAVEAKLETLKQLFAKETNYVALLEDIEATVVSGAQLQRLELTGDETQPLELQFIVSDKLVGATLRNSLEASERFKFVDIQTINETATPTGTQIIASYKLSYEPGQGR